MPPDTAIKERLEASLDGRERFARLTIERLRELNLSRREFGRRIGLSATAVGYILECINRPKPVNARRWVDALQLSPARRAEALGLLDYVLDTERDADRQASPSDWADAVPVASLFHTAARTHEAATYRSSPREAKKDYDSAREQLVWLTEHLSRHGHGRFPALLAEGYTRLSDIHNVQNHLPEALDAALQARQVARRADDPALRVETLRVLGVALNNLGRYDRGARLLEACVATAPASLEGTTWRFFAERDRLVAHIGADAGDTTAEGYALLDRAEQLADPLAVLLARETLARALVSLGESAHARRVLEPVEPEVDAPYLGPLHRMILLLTLSRAYAREVERWAALLTRADDLAREAGLTHQRDRMLRFHEQKLAALGIEPKHPPFPAPVRHRG